MITNFYLLQYIWKPTVAILTEQYIKSSNLAFLYSEVDSRKAYNELTDNIFLNHTFDKDNFARRGRSRPQLRYKTIVKILRDLIG
ncbi:uncharacterized protein OCT59_014568 [Rhizophagus irregularis]|uniref:uncharacterized protein n=1 Tax=Rhizophagus irregularis TaxID=588596 RepID=UPI0033233283|nr:hypothetical protein OCT59_014568 [Rhizophagus irregularis]